MDITDIHAILAIGLHGKRRFIEAPGMKAKRKIVMERHGKMSKPDRIKRDEMYGNRRLKISLPDHRPSWKTFGDGLAYFDVDFYARSKPPCIGITAEETYFASKALGEKRDMTKTAMLNLSRESAIALRDELNIFILATEDL